MKYLLAILTLLQTTNSFGQRTSDNFIQPFQTLYAENAKNGKGQNIKSLDMIGINDVLTIENGGTITLIHFTGFPIEINTDTTLVIKDLQALFNVSGKNQMKAKSNYISVDPSLEHLFISKRAEAMRHKLSISRTCHDCTPEIQFLYPPLYLKQDLNYTNELCLKWSRTDTRTYHVDLIDKSKRILKTYLATTNELTIKGEEIKELSKEKKDIFLIIQDNENVKFSKTMLVKELQLNKIELPYTCELRKSSLALMTGLYLELLSGDYLDEAEKYFIQATELSDRQFYKEMLDNFKKRRER